MPDHPWVLVEWERIEPDDVVRAPDGTSWVVTGKIDGGSALIDFQIERDRVAIWTERPRTEKVNAWRFADAPALLDREGLAIGALRLGGFDVDVIS